MGSMLCSGETDLAIAKEKFGPILLQTNWIGDPDGTWGKSTDILGMWGQYETVYRLVFLVTVMWLALCTTVIIRVPGSNRESRK